MNEASLSLILFTSNFIISQKSIEKVEKGDFLPFLAILFILLQKWEPNKKFDVVFGSNSIEKFKQAVETVTSKLTSLSIDFIVSNYTLFVNNGIFKCEEMLQLITFFLYQMFNGEYKGNKMILLFAIFDMSHRFQDIKIKAFFNIENLFYYIFGHLREINDYDKYNESLPFLHHTLNLDCIDSTCIISQFFELKQEEVIQGLHFVNNFLNKNLRSECVENMEDLLLQLLQTNAKEKNWEQLLYVVRFMEENQISENIEILHKMKIPKNIKDMIFRSTVRKMLV